MSNLLKKLQNTALLSDTETIVAKYLIENYRDLSNLSTRELAKRTFTSSAAIVRFCQKLGFEGYSDFRIHFLTEMMQHGNEAQAQLISEQDNINTLMDKVREININAINETYNLLNPALVSRVLKLFENATYIDFYTVDRCRNFANELSETFALVKKYSSIHLSMPLQYLQAYKTPKNHLGFFISPSGENRMLIDIAKMLKRQGIPTFLITAKSNSTLAELVTEHFVATIGDNVEDLGTLVFLTSTKFVTDILLASLITKTHYQDAIDKKSWLVKTLRY